MSASIKALLFEAIECSWIGVIDSYLQRGGNPNLSFDQQTISCGSFLEITCKRGESIKLLHLAIATCCNKIDAEITEEEWKVAVSLIDSLVEAGASLDATLTFEGKRVANVLVEEIPRVYLEYKPLNFARLLIQRSQVNNTDSTLVRQRLDSLYAKLVPSCPTASPHHTPAMVTVPQSVVDTYKKLLFSSELSDLKFVCEDGQEFPVHRAILAAASPDYFATAFAGPWKENNPQGEWHTSYPSSIIKAVLTFVYTGEILDVLVMQETPIQMLSIAGEFGFTSLQSFAATECIKALNVQQFKSILQLAHLHNIQELKMACFEFAKEHATSVLTNAEVLQLPTEDAVLWEEFKNAVAPDSNNWL